MKQYALLSLALLLSAPIFGMEQTCLPTPIHDSTDSAKAPEAFIGFHTFAEEEASELKTPQVTPPFSSTNKYSILNQAVKDAKVIADLVTASTDEYSFTNEVANAMEARAARLKEEIKAGKLVEAAEIASVHLFAKQAKENAELDKQLDAKLALQKAAPESAVQRRMEELIALANIRPESDEVEEDSEYESETEIGLSQENKKLYRFSKTYVDSITKTLVKAHPYLKAWFENPENDRPLKSLPALTYQLRTQTNRLEIWLKQESSYKNKQTTAFQRLRETVKGLQEGIAALVRKNEDFRQKHVGDISHPATQFLMTADSLLKLIKN